MLVLLIGTLFNETFVEMGGAFSLWPLDLWKADMSSTLDGVDMTRALKSGDGGISTKTWYLVLRRPHPGVYDADNVLAMGRNNGEQLW